MEGWGVTWSINKKVSLHYDTKHNTHLMSKNHKESGYGHGVYFPNYLAQIALSHILREVHAQLNMYI